MSDLVRNPEDRFSQVAAQMVDMLFLTESDSLRKFNQQVDLSEKYSQNMHVPHLKIHIINYSQEL